MTKETMRTHVILPRELVESVDDLVGERGRSKFFAEAIQEKMARIRLAQAAKRAKGSLVNVDVPGWETSASAAAWVHASRQADEEYLRNRREEP